MTADQSRDPGGNRSVITAPTAGLPRWGWGVIAVIGVIAAYNAYRAVESSAQLTALERERVSLIQDKGRIDTALTAARKQVDELKSIQAASEAEIRKSREDVKAASNQAMQLQERVKSLENELGGVRGVAAAAQSDSEKLRQELVAAGKAKADAEAKSAGLEREIGAMSKRLADTSLKLEEALKAHAAAQPAPAAPAAAPPSSATPPAH